MIGWPNRAWHTEDPGAFMALCPGSRESLAMSPRAVCGFSLGGFLQPGFAPSATQALAMGTGVPGKFLDSNNLQVSAQASWPDPSPWATLSPPCFPRHP